jgi:hypothetical protein
MIQATQRSLQIQKQVEDALAAKNNLEQLEQFVFERTGVTATVALADFGSCAYPLK